MRPTGEQQTRYAGIIRGRVQLKTIICTEEISQGAGVGVA